MQIPKKSKKLTNIRNNHSNIELINNKGLNSLLKIIKPRDKDLK